MQATEFKRAADFIEEMKATSSTNQKKEILTKYDSPFLRKLLEYTYTPFKQYYVTKDTLLKRQDLCHPGIYSNLFQMLDDLNDRNVTGHHAIEAVNGFIAENKEFSELILDVIDRNIKTRATATLINSVMPGTVPSFEVALAEKFDSNEKRVDFDSKEWWASRKLDGVRCVTVIDANGDVKFFSRQGKEFLTLSKLAADIKSLGLRSKVFDGEVCIMRDGGLEDFQGIIKEIGRKDHTIESPKYYVFDFLDLDEFERGESQISLSARLVMVNAFLMGTRLRYTEPLIQIKLESREHFEDLVADATKMGYEGIMIRKDVGYEGKRSKNLLKVKKMLDAEYTVTGVEMGTHRVIESGREVEEEMLKAVYIEHRGNRVRVGSGFTLEQRRHFYKNPNQIQGKTITVQYFEETTDQHGEHSLRFPVIKAIYEKERAF